jgi:hypothetical protein
LVEIYKLISFGKSKKNLIKIPPSVFSCHFVIIFQFKFYFCGKIDSLMRPITIKDIKLLIADNKIEQATNALLDLTAHDTDLENQVILLKSQFAEHNHNINLNLIERNEERAKLVNGLLYLTNEVAKNLEKTANSTQNSQFKTQNPSLKTENTFERFNGDFSSHVAQCLGLSNQKS